MVVVENLSNLSNRKPNESLLTVDILFKKLMLFFFPFTNELLLLLPPLLLKQVCKLQEIRTFTKLLLTPKQDEGNNLSLAKSTRTNAAGRTNISSSSTFYQLNQRRWKDISFIHSPPLRLFRHPCHCYYNIALKHSDSPCLDFDCARVEEYSVERGVLAKARSNYFVLQVYKFAEIQVGEGRGIYKEWVKLALAIASTRGLIWVAKWLKRRVDIACSAWMMLVRLLYF